MISIRVVTIGHMPPEFDKQRIKRWSSSIFEIDGEIESLILQTNSDSSNWSYSDQNIIQALPSSFEANFLLAITNVALEDNWYSRHLAENKIVFSFNSVRDYLVHRNIPMENIVLRILYAYSLAFLRFGNRIPSIEETAQYTHDETKGCLYDMTGRINEVVYSCDRPIICDACVTKLLEGRVSEEKIERAKREIKRIRKPLFYRLADFIKKHPVWSLLISAVSAIVLGAIGSLLATIIYNNSI